MCNCPDLAAAIRDLITAVNSLHDELRQIRLARQADIGALIALYQRPKATDAEGSSRGDGYDR